MSEPEQNSSMPEITPDFSENGYPWADFDADGDLTINGLSIEKWLRRNPDSVYGVSRKLQCDYYTPEGRQEATQALIAKKREEAKWAKFWLSETATVAEIEAAVPRFAEWIASTEIYDGGWNSSPGFIKASRLAKPFLSSASRLMEQNPAALGGIVEFYGQLDSLPREVVQESYNDILTPPAKFINETVNLFSFLGSKKYSANLVPDATGLIRLADRLTDKGVVPEGFWYRVGIRHLNGPPNFEFLEALHDRMLQAGDRQKGRYASHPLYYLDAHRLAEAVIQAAAEDPLRNKQVTAATCLLLQKAIENEGRRLPGQIITVANVLTKLLNDAAQEEDPDNIAALEPIEAGSIQALPLAFARLLYASKLYTPGNEAADYQDSVYISLMNQIMQKAASSHQVWYERKISQRTADLKIMFPRATKAQLEEIALRRGRVTTTLWKRWKPGYGVLS